MHKFLQSIISLILSTKCLYNQLLKILAYNYINISRKMKKLKKNAKNEDKFSFLGVTKVMNDVEQNDEKPDSTPVTQAEFTSKAGNKKELWEFCETGNFFSLISLENIFLPDFPAANVEYLAGIMDDTKK